ncbi:Asp-tRNA(Asn)/Glu-tRNA(Gln) amidotransferase subunit GatA [Peptococcaceae bacterium]|nr:Asp-tRNA(Asn)/Glu-tRNA(Gln) amidotransferase subunit GatA [Peptococcaceae bacterium]
MSLYKMSIQELHELITDKKISCEELVNSIYERIESIENKIQAYITLTKDKAVEKARVVDKKIASGEKISPIAGIPIAIKDNICTEGIRTTCASKMLENFVPPYNATVIEKLNDNDMVMVGKTNMDEFAMGSSTENSAFKVTRNPWDIERVPGGSSGGSAAAVAAGECIAALGSDTGGSIRQPAAFCGVVGIKPTYGAVSRYGLIAFASSLDQIGLFTKNVADCALLLNVICGHDPRDSTSVKYDKPDYTQSLKNDVKGLKIGVPKEYLSKGLDPKVHDIFKNAVRTFEKLGAIVDEMSLKHTDYALPTYYLIATAEASSNLARYDGVRYGYRAANSNDVQEMFINSRSEGFGDEVKRRIMLGTYVLSSGYYDAYYLKALKVRTLIKKDFDENFEKYDLILTPATPTPAFKIGENISDPLKMYLQDIFTLSVNLAGLPGLSIPAGFVDGLPVSIQIIAKHFDEPTILRAAYSFEQSVNLDKFPEEVN